MDLRGIWLNAWANIPTSRLWVAGRSPAPVLAGGRGICLCRSCTAVLCNTALVSIMNIIIKRIPYTV